MALQTSGAISFSQIASEFGGSGSHSLSEYRALAGQGVSGIPSSGSISFSHFHGKSNQVIRSVWVTSGYNQTSFQHIATITAGNRSWNATTLGGYWHYNTDSNSAGYAINAGNSHGLPAVPYYRKNYINAYRTTEFWVGTRRYSRGTYRSTPKTTRYHDLVIWDNVTSWVDTSGYQNQATTVRITT